MIQHALHVEILDTVYSSLYVWAEFPTRRPLPTCRIIFLFLKGDSCQTISLRGLLWDYPFNGIRMYSWLQLPRQWWWCPLGARPPPAWRTRRARSPGPRPAHQVAHAEKKAVVPSSSLPPHCIWTYLHVVSQVEKPAMRAACIHSCSPKPKSPVWEDIWLHSHTSFYTAVSMRNNTGHKNNKLIFRVTAFFLSPVFLLFTNLLHLKYLIPRMGNTCIYRNCSSDYN